MGGWEQMWEDGGLGNRHGCGTRGKLLTDYLSGTEIWKHRDLDYNFWPLFESNTQTRLASIGKDVNKIQF